LCLLSIIFILFFFFFFFQAEDGIRDRTVTGVQTCALPILPPHALQSSRITSSIIRATIIATQRGQLRARRSCATAASVAPHSGRSEERRVGKEGRSRWAADH